MKAQEWNATHPIGTAVRYWPYEPRWAGDVPRETRTSSAAWELPSGLVVVLVEGVSGCVVASWLEVCE